MAEIDTLHTLLIDEIKDLYDAEKRITKALPKLIKKSENGDLTSALESHLRETEGQVDRLEQIFGLLDETAKGKPCAGMKGILEEGDEHVGEDYADDSLRDAVIIGSAQRVEHYEIAAYGTAIAHANLLGLSEVAELLEETLAEEKAADQKLTEIAESVVNEDALRAADESEGVESPDETGNVPPRQRASSSRSARNGNGRNSARR